VIIYLSKGLDSCRRLLRLRDFYLLWTPLPLNCLLTASLLSYKHLQNVKYKLKKSSGRTLFSRNPVPNIQRFIESLDADKKNRDIQLEAEMKTNRSNGEVKDHVEGQSQGVKGTRKTVTDPTTGNQVQIENVNGIHEGCRAASGIQKFTFFYAE
jgi:hypothetical protein